MSNANHTANDSYVEQVLSAPVARPYHGGPDTASDVSSLIRRELNEVASFDITSNFSFDTLHSSDSAEAEDTPPVAQSSPKMVSSRTIELDRSPATKEVIQVDPEDDDADLSRLMEVTPAGPPLQVTDGNSPPRAPAHSTSEEDISKRSFRFRKPASVPDRDDSKSAGASSPPPSSPSVLEISDAMASDEDLAPYMPAPTPARSPQDERRTLSLWKPPTSAPSADDGDLDVSTYTISDDTTIDNRPDAADEPPAPSGSRSSSSQPTSVRTIEMVSDISSCTSSGSEAGDEASVSSDSSGPNGWLIIKDSKTGKKRLFCTKRRN